MSRVGQICSLEIFIGLALITLLSACFPGPSDRQDHVHDLRVLAMKMEPPEIEVPLDPAAPPVEVLSTALVVDPARGEIELAFRGCPSPSSSACQSSPADASDPLYQPLMAERRERLAFPAEPGAPELLPTDLRAYPAATMNRLIEDVGFAGIAGARPALELSVDSPTLESHYEVAFKRLQISYPDVFYRVALGELGIPICDAQGQPAGCLEYRTKVPNSNPVLTSLSWQGMREAENGEDPTPVPAEGLEVAAGTTIRIHPDIDADAVEAYQTLGIDLSTEQIVVNDYEELLVLNWFSTAGDFSLSQTVPERDFGAYTDWSAPTEPEEMGVHWLWVVLRDNRGGVDFTRLKITVGP
ncbi:MAG: hypothetical protein P1V51_01825 [Deltaproteobacteria bacterium]|nr:hypothetical protein [Deltaproteobacteria bacterium]